jgi:uncharacterized protein YcbK (DUF882 family)
MTTYIDINEPIPGCPNITMMELTDTLRSEFAEKNRLVPIEFLAARNDIAKMGQAVRDEFGPISIHSGWRTPELNAAIKGSRNSQHMKMQAIDFHIVGVELEVVWDWIRTQSGLQFGQCLIEGTSPTKTGWIHLSLGGKYYKSTPGRRVGRSIDGGRTFTWYA